MSTDPESATRSLPERPNLRHLKAQAVDLLRSGGAESVTDAQFRIARQYGFASWPKLKAHIELLAEAGQLKEAIDRDDLEQVKRLMTRNPSLHRAPLGYGKDGPLTWAAECRWQSGWRTALGLSTTVGPQRLAIVDWMIRNGSDIHQGGDGPLMRAALNSERIPMMELLVSLGADVNAEWHDSYPIVFAPCEALDPPALEWLIDHGAKPNCARAGRHYGSTALDFLLEGYVRCSADLVACIDILLRAGAESRYNVPVVLDLLRNRLERVAQHLDEDPQLLNMPFPELAFGATGGRGLTLRGATLLHVAAEYCNPEAVTLLLDRGADVNALATVDEHGVGGQTPLFHSATQFGDRGLPVTRLLVDRGADLALRATVPGHYERPGEVFECTALEYAERLQDVDSPGDKAGTVAFLRER